MKRRTWFLLATFSLLLLSQATAVHAAIVHQEWILLGTDEEDTASSYVLLATETIRLGANSEVKSGNIGANGIGDHRITISIGPNAKVSACSKIKGNYIWLKINSQVSDVYYNQIRKSPNVEIQGEEHTPLNLPVASLPYFPSFTPGTTNIVVAAGQTYYLDSGDYGYILVMSGAKLVFTGGIYNLKSLVAQADTELSFNAPSEVRVAEEMTIGSIWGADSKVGPEVGSGIDASDIVFYVSGNDGFAKAVEGANAEIEANIYAPNGTVLLKMNVDATGAFIGKNIMVWLNSSFTLNSAFAHYAGADKTSLFFYNDGVYAYFKETLASTPDPSSFTYTVYLDKPAEGTYPQDFRLVYSCGTASLQRWNGTSWNHLENISVELDSDSITFNVSLSSMANPCILENTNVWFTEYLGANSYEYEVDRAPNAGSYFIACEVIPELPWPTPLIFIPAVLSTVYLVQKKGYKERRGGTEKAFVSVIVRSRKEVHLR